MDSGTNRNALGDVQHSEANHRTKAWVEPSRSPLRSAQCARPECRIGCARTCRMHCARGNRTHALGKVRGGRGVLGGRGRCDVILATLSTASVLVSRWSRVGRLCLLCAKQSDTAFPTDRAPRTAPPHAASGSWMPPRTKSKPDAATQSVEGGCRHTRGSKPDAATQSDRSWCTE